MTRGGYRGAQLLVAAALIVLAIVVFGRLGTKGLAGLLWGTDFSLDSSNSRFPSDIKLGVYDFDGNFDEFPYVGIQHLFINWSTYSSTELRADLKRAAERNRWPMITVEPYPEDNNADLRDNLFQHIAQGKYDHTIARLCADLIAFGRPVFLRWGHEMENVTERYPWAQKNHQGYVEAYRYFVDRTRNLLGEVYYVWSPVGMPELVRYWPGPEYVDFIGLSVYGFPTVDLRFHGWVRTFEDIFHDKMKWVYDFNKPVMIAELGVTGGERHQREWMSQAFPVFRKYDRLKAVVYFNARDSELAWGKDYAIPDWRIEPKVLR